MSSIATVTATLEYAQKYIDAGLSIIPLKYRDKRPIGSWKKYQQHRAGSAEIERWFQSPANIGLVMGNVSGGLIALDFDVAGAFEAWVEKYPHIAGVTAMASTGKGYHVLLRMPPPIPANWKMSFQGEHVGETRGEGGYIVAAPSIHPSGRVYEWIRPPWDGIITVNSLADVGISQFSQQTHYEHTNGTANGYHPLPRRTLEFMTTGALGHNAAGVNDELYHAAMQFSAAGYSEPETINQLMPAAHKFYIGRNKGNTEGQAIATIKSGWKNGREKQPIKLVTNGAGAPRAGVTNSTATNAADELQKLTKPTYSAENGMMVYTTYKTADGNIIANRRVMAPFVAKITEKLTIYDEHEQRVTYTVSGKKGHRAFTAQLDADDWADPKRLVSMLLRYLPGKPPETDPALRRHWGAAISALTDEDEMKEIKAIPSTGWTPDGKAFVMPGGGVGSGYQCHIDPGLEPELRHFKLEKRKNSDLRRVVAALFSLTRIYRPAVIYTLLAHVFLPPLLHFVGDDVRYLYHIYADTGSFKTVLATLMMSFYGPTDAAAITYKWTNTPYGAESRAHALKDCLMLIDDLKPGTINEVDKAKWVAFVQAAVDAQGRKRASISGRAATSLPPRALLLSTGEAIPEAGEASYTARMLLAELNTQPPGRNTLLDEIKKISPMFNALMFEFIQWLLDGNGHGAREIYRDLQALGIETKHQRLANNFASNRLGAVMLAKFLLARGLITERTARIYLERHQRGLEQIVENTANKAHEERYSQRFINALKDAIETGFAKVTNFSEDHRVGWKDDKYLYLLNGSKEVVDQWLRISGQTPINISKRDLRKQLYNDGLSHSTTSRVTVGQYDYQALDPATKSRSMVIAIRLDAFDVQLDENLHETHETHEK